MSRVWGQDGLESEGQMRVAFRVEAHERCWLMERGELGKGKGRTRKRRGRVTEGKAGVLQRTVTHLPSMAELIVT